MPEYTHAVAEIAREAGLKLHLDGARVFNAAAALAVDVKDLVRDVDSVQVCLSKGLCAPVGSLICGSAGFIAEARRTRKMLGGGMRQAGILAAAGIVALDEMANRIGEDHVQAKRLADGLAHSGTVVSPPASIFSISVLPMTTVTPEEVVAGLEARGVRVLGRIGWRFRANGLLDHRRRHRPRRVRYGGSDRLIDRPQAPFSDERLDFLWATNFQCGQRQFFCLTCGQRADDLFGDRNGGRIHTELIQAQAQKIGIASGSPAISPHMPTDSPCARAALMTSCTIRSTAGRNAFARSDTSALVRSAAIVYWHRSLCRLRRNQPLGRVGPPLLRQPGSTMMPISIESAAGVPSYFSSCGIHPELRVRRYFFHCRYHREHQLKVVLVTGAERSTQLRLE